jgi:hypothetical protein
MSGIILGAIAKSRKGTTTCSPVRPSAQLGFQWTNSYGIRYLSIFQKSVEKLNFHENVTRITSTLHEGVCNFKITSRLILFRMEDISEKL